MGSRCLRGLLLIFILTFWVSRPGSAQTSVATQPEGQRIGQESDPIPRDIAARMAKERLKNRYENVKRDSEKLLELATELKQYVDKSGDNVLSLEVIRKCEEIEKLSKSVRTKMKGD